VKERRMIRITQLGYLGIGVSDIEQWERFATETLGLEVSGRGDDGTLLLRMDEQSYRFAIHPDGKDDIAYVGWQVTDQQEMEGMAEQLKADGVEVIYGTQAEAEARRVTGLLKYDDPSGIASEVFFGPQVNFNTPFKSPRPISGFVTGDQGLGHIVLKVDDLDRSLAFYRDVLGMRISDFVGRMAFFHCNPRHHTLAIGNFNAPKQLLHFMLQTNVLDDVGTTYYLCQDQDIPIARGLGRHTNDHMMSFYMRNPSGFEVEYGWGARVVDDNTWQVQRHTGGSIWGHRRVEEQAARS
jgi:biphenyl-2,3-diol 1,2-dioxygenase